MLKNVGVRAYRCFDNSKLHTMTFTEETVIMGPNNSGKSSLLSVIDFFRSGLWDFPGIKLAFSSEIHNWLPANDLVHRGDMGPQTIVTLDIESDYQYNLEATYQSPHWRLKPSRSVSMYSHQFLEQIRGIWHVLPVRPELPTSQGISSRGTAFQPLLPNGQNVIQFLLERWTSRDSRWDEAEKWLRRIDPSMSLLMTPLRGDAASIETKRHFTKSTFDTNIAFQGTGMQSACSVIAALVYSPPGSVVIIEEPEAYLHPASQEIIVDLMNTAVNEWEKQVIVSTHSLNILLPFMKEIISKKKRGGDHVKADPEKFSTVLIDENHQIEHYGMGGKEFKDVRDKFKGLWG